MIMESLVFFFSETSVHYIIREKQIEYSVYAVAEKKLLKIATLRIHFVYYSFSYAP